MNSHSGLLPDGGASRLLMLTICIIVLALLGSLVYICSPASLDDSTLLAAEKSNGPWAQAYRESVGARRDAIYMLFRCSIVSPAEVMSDNVEQERIEEGIWV